MSGTITSVTVHGASGRMGARLCAIASDDPRFILIAAIARGHTRALGADSAAPKTQASAVKITPSTDQRADVVIDFSSDHGARNALDLALRHSSAILVGTTALSDFTLAALRDASQKIPVLIAANTSLGVPVLARAAADCARALGPSFDISIVEAHHSRKKDAPSGTAIRLVSAITDAGGAVHDDQVLSIRGGDVVGEHTIRFAGPGEYIELTHRATSRDVFVHGALSAAAWLATRSAGWYTMEDVLGLSRK